MCKALLVVLLLSGCTAMAPPPEPGSGPAGLVPAGQSGGWRLAFADEFDGRTLDRSKWADASSAEADDGHGNPGNQQLEWNQAANCTVGGGELVMTARREQVTSPSSGRRYEWTSCLITTRQPGKFQYGFVEERAILPAVPGFWPALWTWQAKGAGRPTETDVYEFYSDNHARLYSTQYSESGGRCEWRPRFDPSAGWHTYGAAIEPSGTTWYADGVRVCHTNATSDGPTNLISNLAVYAKIPPDPSTRSATKRVDWIRVWTRTF